MANEIWLTEEPRVGIPDELRLQEVPRDFNYNNYDPHSQVIKNNKDILREQLKRKLITYKQYSACCTKMKAGFKNQSFVDVPPSEFSNKIIVGSNFSQNEPDTRVFPDGVVNCTLKNCVALNAVIPAGFILENTKNERIKTQNDGEYWIVDKDLKPISPLSPKRYDKLFLSKDPKGLPDEPLSQSIIMTAEEDKKKEDRKEKIKTVAGDEALLDLLIEKGEQL